MWRNKPATVAPIDAGGVNPEATGVRHAPGQGAAPAAAPSVTQGIANGIRIVGDIKGQHDLTIAGEVSGSIFLPENQVRVCAGGEVYANITARVIEVEGMVTGDLKAADRVLIRKSSRVAGDIFSPQIQLEEGCQFKGSVQMREPDVSRKPPTKPRMMGAPGTVRIKAANE